AGSEILGFRALRAKRPAPTAEAPSSRLLEQWKPSRLPAFLFSRCSRIPQRATSFPPAQTSQRAGSCEMRPMVGGSRGVVRAQTLGFALPPANRRDLTVGS